MEQRLYSLRIYKKGSIIWMENSKAMPYFFILKSGQLRQSLKIMLHQEVTLLNKGDTFGLIACMTSHNYLDRLVAFTDSEVIMVHKEHLVPFLSTKPKIFLKIIGDYSNKLRSINQKLFSLCSDSLYSNLPEHILEIAEYFKKKGMLNHYYYALKKYIDNSRDEERKIFTIAQVEDLEKTKKISLPQHNRKGAHVFYKAGDIIFLEQEKGGFFYFIETGKVKISHINREKEYVIAVLNKGEFFGEMAILNQVCRNATAIAFEDCRLLMLSKDTFMNQLGGKILQNIFISFAKRIWYSFRRSVNLSYKNPVTRLYDCLDFIIQSKEGQRKDMSYYFDISLTDLRVMTNTSDIEDKVITDFLNDENIRLNYDQISIINLDKFNDTLKLYLSRERTA